MFAETSRLLIYNKYFDKSISTGVTFEHFSKSVDIFLENNPTPKFDEEYLPPNDFCDFCNILDIPFQKLLDKYYRFTLITDFPSLIKSYRESNNINQKEFAQIVNISPNNIGKFENNIKYPSRSQFIRITNLIKNNKSCTCKIH